MLNSNWNVCKRRRKGSEYLQKKSRDYNYQRSEFTEFLKLKGLEIFDRTCRRVTKLNLRLLCEYTSEKKEFFSVIIILLTFKVVIK